MQYDNTQDDDRNYVKTLALMQDACRDMNIVAEGEVCEPEEFFHTFACLSGEAFGHLLLQVIGSHTDHGTEALKASGKKLAVDVADILGPDHAQALYRFAVLVTKLA